MPLNKNVCRDCWNNLWDALDEAHWKDGTVLCYADNTIKQWTFEKALSICRRRGEHDCLVPKDERRC